MQVRPVVRNGVCPVAIAACFALILAGCHSAPETRGDDGSDAALAAASPNTGPTAGADPLGQLPDDLVLDVTVLPGRDVGDPAGAQQIRSRYILFPDGSLRADAGPSLGVLTRPAPVRTVTREQAADLWFVARQCGFGDPATAPFDGNPALLAPNAKEILTIVTVRRDGRYGTFLERLPAPVGATPDANDVTPSGRLVRAMARLAWASDEPPMEMVVLPLRYDLGPNPYSRYRPVAGLPPKKPATVPVGGAKP